MDKPISPAEPPETLVEAIRYFADPDVCLTFMAGLRWPDGVVKCPTCGSDTVSFLSTRRIWKCREEHERRQFSIKVGTVFEDSPIPLEKWLPAMWMLINCKNGISSYEMGRALGVTQRTAWFMNHRLRLVIQTGTFAKMSGEVEVDAVNLERRPTGARDRGACAHQQESSRRPWEEGNGRSHQVLPR